MEPGQSSAKSGCLCQVAPLAGISEKDLCVPCQHVHVDCDVDDVDDADDVDEEKKSGHLI